MIKICQWCAQPFYIKDSHAEKRKHCSFACLGASRSITQRGRNNPNFRDTGWHVCQHCQQPFHSYEKNKKYCSRECYGKARTAAKNQRSVAVQLFLIPSTRQKPRTRNKRQCVICQRAFLAIRGIQIYCHDCGYITLPCVICTTPIRMHRGNKKDTCSPTCAHQWRSLRQKGERSHRWQGGKTNEAVLRRTRREYDSWRSAVYARDDYTCAMCTQRGGKLAAHHIMRVTDAPALIYEISNGVTLCWECHHSIHWKEAAYAPKFMAFLVGHVLSVA